MEKQQHVVNGLKRHALLLMVIVAVSLMVAQTVTAEIPVPALKGRVNDYAGLLTSATARNLEAKLASIEQSDSTQMAVLTINSLEGEAIEQFSIRVAEEWKIGQKDTDNGALLVVSRQDRKIRIEVGYGLEGRLTDLVSGQIIRNVIVPEFKRGQFDQGIASGVDAMIAVVKGEYTAAQSKQRRSGSRSQGPLFAIIAFIFLVSQLGRANKGLGAAAGGVMMPIFGGMFFHGGLILLLALIPIGIVAGLLLSVLGSTFGTYSATSGGYHHGGLWGGGGGFSSGGGFGGFSGGGGGFGGGGASGGW